MMLSKADPFVENVSEELQYWQKLTASGKTGEVWRTFGIDRVGKYEFLKKVATQRLVTSLVCPVLWVDLPCNCVKSYAYLSKNLQDKVNAEHVAIGADGILYRTETHKAGCRCQCDEVPGASKSVPFDRIQDVQIREPAGAEGPCCCMVPRVLYTVDVQTAATGGRDAEISISGMMDPYGFRRTVLALKRGEGLPSELGPGTIQVPNVDVAGTGLQTPAAGATQMQSSVADTPPSMTMSHMGVGADHSAQIASLLETNSRLLMSIDASLKQQQQQQQQQRSLA